MGPKIDVCNSWIPEAAIPNDVGATILQFTVPSTSIFLYPNAQSLYLFRLLFEIIISHVAHSLIATPEEISFVDLIFSAP